MGSNPLDHHYSVWLNDPATGIRRSFKLRFRKRDIYRAEVKLGHALLGTEMLTAVRSGQALVFVTAVLMAGLVNEFPDLTPDDIADTMLDAIIPDEDTSRECMRAWLEEIYNPAARVRGLPTLDVKPEAEPPLPLPSDSGGNRSGDSPGSTSD